MRASPLGPFGPRFGARPAAPGAGLEASNREGADVVETRSGSPSPPVTARLPVVEP
jgi:hypothetical protein